MNLEPYRHSVQQQLEQNLYGGSTLLDFRVDSSSGVQTIDLVWLSNEQLRLLRDFDVAPFAPRICVDFRSDALAEQKKNLLLTHYAEEVWLCDAAGQLAFYNQSGQLAHSRIAPRFQSNVTIDKD